MNRSLECSLVTATGLALAALVALGSPGFARAQALADAAGPPAAAPADDGVEEIEDVQQVQPVSPIPGRAGSMTASIVVGRLHPALVHFPIAWLLAVLLLDLMAGLLRIEGLEKASLILLGLGLAAAAPAILSGLLRASELVSAGARDPTLGEHRNLMFLAVGAALAALVLKLGLRKRAPGAARWVNLSLLSAAVVLMFAGVHLGGRLVFGEAYLPFYSV